MGAMTKTLTIDLSERGSEAYAALKNGGVDPDAVIDEALLARASRLRMMAEEAARLRQDAIERTQLEKLRDLPPQIEYVRPPR